MYSAVLGIREAAPSLPSLRRLGLLAGAALIAAALLLPWRPGVVVGTSMTPTLAPGSVFVYDRDYYRTNEVVPGDIVVVRHNGAILVKRIYAAPGDRFWAYREFVAESPVHDPVPIENLDRRRRLADFARTRMGRIDVRVVTVRVPQGCAFLLGDGWESVDSRHFGFVPVDDILGRVIERQSMPQQHVPRGSGSAS